MSNETQEDDLSIPDFTSLAHHVTRERVQKNLSQIPKRSAAGVDGQTVEAAKESFEEWIEPMLQSIHRQGYRAPDIRRVYIPLQTGYLAASRQINLNRWKMAHGGRVPVFSSTRNCRLISSASWLSRGGRRKILSPGIQAIISLRSLPVMSVPRDIPSLKTQTRPTIRRMVWFSERRRAALLMQCWHLTNGLSRRLGSRISGPYFRPR